MNVDNLYGGGAYAEKKGEIAMAGIPRMRSIQQCAAYFKEQDPGTGVGEWCIRQMVNRGEIPVVRSGRKILINLDMLIEHMSGEESVAEGEKKDLNILEMRR